MSSNGTEIMQAISNEAVEAGAEGIWQAQSIRITGKPRSIKWAIVLDEHKNLYRVESRTALTAALPHLQAQWQDISTAPKDGTKIILYHEKWDTFPVASWEWGEGPDEDGTGGWCAWHTVDDRFPSAEDGIIFPSENHMPTHWQPLPAAPLIAEQREVKP